MAGLPVTPAPIQCKFSCNGPDMKTLIKAADIIDAFIDWTGRVTSWLVLVLVLLIAAQVLLRYTMSIGAVWAQELEWHLLAVIALCGVAYTQKEDAHVRVDILFQKFSKRTQQWIEFLTAVLVMTPLSLYIAWVAVGFVMQSYNMNEISPDPGGLQYRFALKAFVIVGFGLLAIQSVAVALRNAALIWSADKGEQHAVK